MTALSLPDFLLQRLAEDEAAAKAATQGNPRGPWRETVTDDGEPAVSVYGYPADPVIVRAVEFADAEHVARHDPARVLADVEAKRRIVEMFESRESQAPYHTAVAAHATGLLLALRALAAVYADHPDYREEWKP